MTGHDCDAAVAQLQRGWDGASAMEAGRVSGRSSWAGSARGEHVPLSGAAMVHQASEGEATDGGVDDDGER